MGHISTQPSLLGTDLDLQDFFFQAPRSRFSSRSRSRYACYVTASCTSAPISILFPIPISLCVLHHRFLFKRTDLDSLPDPDLALRATSPLLVQAHRSRFSSRSRSRCACYVTASCSSAPISILFPIPISLCVLRHRFLFKRPDLDSLPDPDLAVRATSPLLVFPQSGLVGRLGICRSGLFSQ